MKAALGWGLADCRWGQLPIITAEEMLSYFEDSVWDLSEWKTRSAGHFLCRIWMSSPFCNPWFLVLATVLCNCQTLWPWELPPRYFLSCSYWTVCFWVHVDPEYLREFIWHQLSFGLKLFSCTPNWFWFLAIKKPGEIDRVLESHLGRKVVRCFLYYEILFLTCSTFMERNVIILLYLYFDYLFGYIVRLSKQNVKCNK